MKFDQQDALVICICPGLNGRWDVAEKGWEEPMASFDEKEDAYAYAACLSRTRQDSTVLVEDDDGYSAMPPQGDAGHVQDGRMPDHARSVLGNEERQSDMQRFAECRSCVGRGSGL